MTTNNEKHLSNIDKEEESTNDANIHNLIKNPFKKQKNNFRSRTKIND